MAALCTGSYGLSQNCTDNSKEYFFVKLTDSAYRAIEQYQRNQNKCNSRAKIQILENGGMISFPTATESTGQQFTFTIDEIEGSLECIQQKQTQLDVLGTLQYKMRIHANDDVYETTRHRMAVAEETQKKKSTVEIKPNQTDIGRKVKLKNSNNRLPNIPTKRDHHSLNNLVTPSQFISNSSSSLTSNSMSPHLTNGIVSLSSTPLSPSTDKNHNQVSSSSLSNSETTASNNINGLQSLSLMNSTTSSSSGGYLPTQNLKNNLSSNNINKLTNSSSKYLQNYNSNNRSTNNINVNGNSLPTGASSLSSALSSAAGSGTSGINSNYFSNSNSNCARITNGTAAAFHGVGNRKNASIKANNLIRNSKTNNRHNSLDIKKRSLRERLIHMLALKNFKKPEIYARLQNEGIREKEKSVVSTILKEISILRDNTFNLKRQIWNEVNEDWPFYMEQELQILKRRKPQNLTPPLSSDGGSSTSGQSPTSTHNGSPPPTVKRPSIERGNYYEEPTSKKQRISHFKKDIIEVNCANVRQNQDLHDNNMGISYSVLGSDAARRISPRDGAPVLEQNISNYNTINLATSNHQYSNGINNNNANKNDNFLSSNGNSNNRQQSLHNNHQIGKIPNAHNYNNSNNNKSSSNKNEENLSNDNWRLSSTSMNDSHFPSNDKNCLTNSNVTNFEPNERPTTIENSENNENNNIGASTIEKDFLMKNDMTDKVDKTNRSNIENILAPDNDKFDFSHFKKITTIEQRRKYKTEFGKDYDEYKKLLAEIDSVRRRFLELAEQLHDSRNNDANYKSIKKQIVDEYQCIQNQKEHQCMKLRFNYLHAKLAHIKTLVSDFDKTLTSSDVGFDTQSVSSSDINESGRNKMLYSNTIGSNVNNSVNNNNFTDRGSPNPRYLMTDKSSTSSSLSSSLNANKNTHHLPKTENY